MGCLVVQSLAEGSFCTSAPPLLGSGGEPVSSSSSQHRERLSCTAETRAERAKRRVEVWREAEWDEMNWNKTQCNAMQILTFLSAAVFKSTWYTPLSCIACASVGLCEQSTHTCAANCRLLPSLDSRQRQRACEREEERVHESTRHCDDDGSGYLCQSCPDRLLARLIRGGQLADGHQGAPTESGIGGLLDLRNLKGEEGGGEGQTLSF